MGADVSGALPAGFTLDQPAAHVGLPSGFTLDAPAKRAGASGEWTPDATPDQRLQASAGGRFAQGARDIIDSGAQMLTNALPDGVVNSVNKGVSKVNKLPIIGPLTTALGMVPATKQGINDDIKQNEERYQESRKATGQDGFDAMRMTGGLAVTAPAVAMGPAKPAATVLGRALQAAPVGFGFGLTQPVSENQENFWTEKGKQGGVGALTAGLAAPAMEGVARVISPKVKDTVRLLMNEGVTPTPGQILGGSFQRIEDKATSIPLVGDAIASAQRKGIDELNRAMYARALDPIGGKVPQQVGREGVEAVKDQLGRAYDSLLPSMKFAADQQYTAQMQQLSKMARNLPRQEARQFEQIIKSEINDRLTPQGLGAGETLKTIESQLGKKIGDFSKSTDAYQQQLAAALKEAQSAFREAIKRANPQFADELSAINKGYANYAKIRDAASRQGSNNGIVTPGQLSGAVRAGDKTAGKGGYATGNALMQDLSDAAKDVLASKYPDSGTTGRALTGVAAGGGAYMLSPSILTGGAIASGAYLPGGRQLAAALLARRPQGAEALANGIRRLPAPVSVPLSQALLQPNQ